MPSNHTYNFREKGYKGTAVVGQNIQWTRPSSIAEALKPGPDTNGQPYFADEQTLLDYAVAQLNIRKGHAVQAAALGKNKDEEGNAIPAVTDLAGLAKIGQSTVAERLTRRTGQPSQKDRAEKLTKVENKIRSKIETYTPEQLAFAVEAEIITQADMDAELARRGQGAAATGKRAAK